MKISKPFVVIKNGVELFGDDLAERLKLVKESKELQSSWATKQGREDRPLRHPATKGIYF